MDGLPDHADGSTVVPPYPLIQFPRFQLTAFYRGKKKKFEKSNKYTVHKLQNAFQAKTGPNMMKSSSPNAPST
jgi:hypothetical protein